MLCASEPYRDRAGQPTTSAAIEFDSSVDEDVAVAMALSLLPEDAQIVDRLIGTNSDFSSSNTCVSIDVISRSLGDISGNKDTASILLYPDQQTDLGSSAMFSGTVRQVHLSTGQKNEDGDPAC